MYPSVGAAQHQRAEPHRALPTVRSIGRIALINCASPAYQCECGTPRNMDELAGARLTVGYAPPTTGGKVAVGNTVPSSPIASFTS